MAKGEGQNLLNRCILALQQAGVKVRTEHGSVTCMFPFDPDDAHAAPDGTEITYTETQFTLLVTRTFLELAEVGVIDPDTGEEVMSGS